jgi:type IX secretion system PorP/SprF family membrane protein
MLQSLFHPYNFSYIACVLLLVSKGFSTFNAINMRINTLRFSGLIFVVMLLMGSFQAKAQQDPLYTNFMFNKLVYNPAFAGTNPEFICATFLLHNQWAGFGSDADDYVGSAPSTNTFSIHAPIPNSNNFGGIGLYVINDVLGYHGSTTANLAFSMKRYFSFGAVYLGINGGIIQRGINNTFWRAGDQNDPDFPNGEQNGILPDLGAGLYVFAQNKFFVGISAQHIIPGQFEWGGPENELVMQSYFTAGYSFVLPSNPFIEFQPSFLYKIDKAKKQFDINMNVMYKNRFWGGLQYRQGDAVSALVGMKLTQNLKFGYSYDLTTTELNKYSQGTHEVLISYCFKIVIKPRVVIPNIIWTPRYL